MIYKIVGTETYIATSMHLLPVDAVELPERLWKIHAQASLVIFEADLGDMGSVATLGYLDKRTSLVEIVPREIYRAAATLWGHLCLDGSVARLKPWNAASTILLAHAERAGFNLMLGVDQQLWDATLESRRGWLEATRGGIECLDTSPRSEQLRSLSDIVTRPDEAVEKLRRLATAWRQQDEQTMASLFDEAAKRAPVTYSHLIGNRNRAWCPRLLKFARSGERVLVVVGAFHMIGKEGLPSLLKEVGAHVESIR